MSLAFSYPLALLLLLLLPLLFVISQAASSRLLLRRRNRRLSLALRSVILTSLVLTLAGAQLNITSDRLAVAFLVDGSDSMGSAKGQAMQFARQAMATMKDTQVAGLVVFGQHATIEKSVDGKKELAEIKSQVAGGYTNLAEAVRLGLAMLPLDTQRRLVLLSDGNQNLEEVRSAAQIAAAQGVQIDVLPLGSQDGPEVSIGAINVAPSVREAEQFDLNVSLTSNYAGSGKLQILQGDKVVSEQQVNFIEGVNLFHQSVTAEKQGMEGYSARIVADRDTVAQNNTSNALVIVKSKPKTLLVEGHPDQNEAANLQEALKAAGIEVTTVPPDKFPPSSVLVTYDSVILQNVPASSVAKSDLDTLKTYVHDLGRGLLVIGGEESYGLGGYFRTPLEEMLPVSLQLPSRQDIPRIAMVLVVDRSGSMTESYNYPGTNGTRGQSKIELAKDAAYLGASQLSNTDMVGVVTFDTRAQWQIPIAPLGQATDLKVQISKIAPGGGTSIYSGLLMGIEGLKPVKAQVKHIVLLTDGQDRDTNNFAQMLDEANKAGITISCIGLGWDVNQTFLRNLASQGGGEYYFADDPTNLPKLFVQESRKAARNYIIEEPFTPAQSAASPIIKGLTDLPQLLGYVGTKPKPNATTVLVSDRQDPILAQWQYGLGRVVAWTSDAKARWSRDWLGWDNFGRFWAQAVRWTVPENEVSGLEVRATPQGDQVLVQADAVSADQTYLNGLNTTVTVVPLDPNDTKKQVVLKQTGPGHYEGYFTPESEGGYTMTVQAAPSDGSALQPGQGLGMSRTLAMPPSYSPEYKQLGINTILLQDLSNQSGGQVLNLQHPEDAFRPGRQSASYNRELWPWLLALALLLLPLDIAVRHFNPSLKKKRPKRGKANAAGIE
jgi:uncharacterized membrane protein